MKQTGTLLLIDDDRHVLTSMAEWLTEIGYQTDMANSYAEGMAAVDSKPYDVALIDVRLGERDGFDILQHCLENHPETSVIMISGYGTAKMAVDAIHTGAFDFLTKPLIDDELEMSIQRALSQRQVIEENETLKQQLDKQFGMDNIIGRDHRMTKVFDIIEAALPGAVGHQPAGVFVNDLDLAVLDQVVFVQVKKIEGHQRLAHQFLALAAVERVIQTGPDDVRNVLFPGH